MKRGNMDKPDWCLAKEYPKQSLYKECICLANTGAKLPKGRSGFCIGKLLTQTDINGFKHTNTHLLCIRGPVGTGETTEELVVPVALHLGDIQVLRSLFEQIEEA